METRYAPALEDSVGTVLLKALLTELKLQSPRFIAMNEEAQQEVIDRLRLQTADAVASAVRSIAARSFTAVRAEVVSVAFKDNVKVTLEMGRLGEGVHAIADGVGGGCMLVLCDAEEFTAGMDQVKPKPNQGDMVADAEAGDD